MKELTKARKPQELAGLLGIAFKDQEMLVRALVHRSYLNEATDPDLESNERLEFLGDAVLGLIISARLYEDYPGLTEGQLSQVRSSLVKWDTLAEAARRINLGDYLIMGRGEETSGGRQRPSNLASGLEALIGATFLDGGFVRARRLVLQLLKPDLAQIEVEGALADSKSALQQVAQRRWRTIPQYRLVSSEGPDHAKLFVVEVVVSDQVMGRGEGPNKKQAELGAARQALDHLSQLNN